MSITPISFSNVSGYLDRLKNLSGGGSSSIGKDSFAGDNSRFAELLNDPMMQLANGSGMKDLLGIGSGDGEDLTSLDAAMLGGMDLMNTKALSTLTKVLSDQQNPIASMYRNISSGIEAYSQAAGADMSNAVRMPVTPPLQEHAASSIEAAQNIQQMDAAQAMQQVDALLSGNESHRSDMTSAMNMIQSMISGEEGGMEGLGADVMKRMQQVLHKQTEATTNTQLLEQPQAINNAASSSITQNNTAGIELTQSVSNMTSSADTAHSTAPFRPGRLSAMFESGAGGNIGAIGYDRHGGTSYGTFQLSSRAGTMDRFISFLERQAPDMASALKKAGPANTGGKTGAMPDAWKSLSTQSPKRFGELQEKFIHSTNYSPAFKAISKAMNLDSMPKALQEVLFSTSVQHGPTGAVRIFAKAFGKTGGFGEGMEADFIKNVYSVRSGQFGSSSSGVQNAVKGRLQDELRMALSMLESSNLV